MTYTEGLLPLSYAYIQPLEPIQSSVVDKAIGMTRLKQCFLANRHRESRIVRLLDIWRPVEVVPVFGKSCPDTWDSSNAVELAKEFYLNVFSSKDDYQQFV